MRAHVLLVCVLVAVVAGLGVGAEDGTSARVYCGRRLARTLALLCENELMMRGGDDYPAPAWAANQLGRDKRQAATDCCDRPCTLDELLSYCD